MFFRSSCHTDIIIGNEAILKHFILPIGISIPAGKIKSGILFINKLLTIQFFELRSIHHLDSVHHMFPAEWGVDIHQSLPLLSLLCSDNDNPISSTHTENSQWRRVFQHFHRLNILGIQKVNVIIEQTVDNVKRFVAVNGVRSTYTDFGVRACLSRVDNLHTGYLSLQGRQGICRRFISDFGSLDIRDRAGQVTLLRTTVTYHYCFSQHLWILFQLYIYHMLAAYFHILLHHSHVREFQYIVGWGGNTVLPIYVGNRTIGSTLNHYGCSNQRFIGRIGYRSGHCLLLSKQRRSHQQQTD